MIRPDFDPKQIEDLESARQAIIELFNLVEELRQENETFRAENQRLRDENNRLKGEQGKPGVKPGKGKKGQEYSSEKERRKPKQWRKSSKIDQIKIDREEVLPVEPERLPTDAQFKGYEAVVVQDICLKSDNIRFLKEKYYSPSRQESYIAPLPSGYQGQFGPGLRSLVIIQYYACGMTEPKIKEFLTNFGIHISAGQVSNLLTKDQELWHTEKDELYRAGLSSSSWQHIDETGTRVDGHNHYCHIVCNPLYTAYFTRPHKDRLTVFSVLQNKTDLSFLLNEHTAAWLEEFALPQWVQQQVSQWPQNILLSQTDIEALVQTQLDRLNNQQQARVYEAAALSAYYQQTRLPVIPVLLSDEARQYAAVTPEQALCWVHEGRHYKKLTPYLPYHRQLLTQQYRASPTPAQAQRLDTEFETLFSIQTGYELLDQRIAKTKAKKDRLLKVLTYPAIPLHNNLAELGARQRVRKRDVSFGPRTTDGVTAWDTFMSLAETAKKLGISFFAYIYDRVTGQYALPSLAQLIQPHSPAFHPIPAG